MKAPALLRLAFLVWTFTFIAFGGTTLLALHPLARLIGVLLFGVPVVAWALLRWRRRVDRLDAAVLVGVAAHLVVSFTSLDPTASLEMSAVVLAYAAVYGMARVMAVYSALRRMFAMAAVMALLFWLVVVAVTWVGEKVVALDALGWPPPAEPTQPWVWGSVNTPPVLALLAGPFLAWLPAGPTRRLLVAVWLVSAAVVAPLSVGRAAWLGIAVALVSAEVLLRFPTLRRLGASEWLAPRIARSAGAVVLSAISLLIVTGRMDGVTAALDSRIRLWEQALRLFATDPLTGAGPSTFAWARLSHVADYVDRVAAKDVHSVPLQTLSDGGILLAVAAAAVTTAWLSLLVARWSRTDAAQRLAVATVAGYGAFALLDDLSFLPSVTVLVIVIAAWAIPPRAPGEEPQARRLPPWTVPAGLLLCGLTAAPSVAAMTAARMDAASGREAAIADDWAGALLAFERAAANHPANAQMWMSVGLAAARAGADARAARAYERARDISPGDPRPWGALAVLADDDATGTQLLDAASRRSNDPRYAYRLGASHASAGDTDAAADAFATSVVLWPDWWSVVPRELWAEVRDRLGDAIARVGSIGGSVPHEAVWNAGLAMGSLAPDAPAPWLAIAAGRDGNSAAAGELLEAVGSSVRADQAMAAVARLECDRDAYDRATARLAARPPLVQPTGHPVRLGPPGLYRNPELGDYQPITDDSVPSPPPWPEGLVELPDCGW